MPNQVRNIIIKRSSFLILLLLILSAVALLRMVTTYKDIDDVGNIDIPIIELLTQIETNQLEQSVNFERAMRYAEEFGRNAFARDHFSNADSTFRYLAKLVDQDLIQIEHDVNRALGGTTSDNQIIKLKGLLLSVKKLETDHTSYENHALHVMDLLEHGKVEEAMVAIEQVESEENEFNKQIEGVLMRHEMFTEALVHIVEKEEVLSIKTIAILTLSFVILSLIAVYSFSYRIWRPLEDIREGADRLGSGLLNTRIKVRSNSITDNIVNAFNTMADNLQESQNDLEHFIQFSYSATQDLKAPVQNLNSLLSMIEDRNLNEETARPIVRSALRSVNQMSKTIEAIDQINQLRFSLTDRSEKLNFDQILREVGTELISKIRSSKASIKKDFSECQEIYYPKNHLKLILFNLLENSLKFRNPEEPLVIYLKTTNVMGQVTLLVKDNGLGFDAIKHGKEILNPFVRLHSSVEEGSGLGLYALNTVVKFHRGNIRVESKPKKGTVFTLRLNNLAHPVT